MDAESEAHAGGEDDGPRVVGGEYPESANPVRRRDNPAPAPWTREVAPGAVPDDYVAKPAPARSMSAGRRVVVTLLIVFLVVYLVNFVVTVVDGDNVSPDMALRLFFGAPIQFVGWWTVIHLMRDR